MMPPSRREIDRQSRYNKSYNLRSSKWSPLIFSSELSSIREVRFARCEIAELATDFGSL
jgi:hypothetical protein